MQGVALLLCVKLAGKGERARVHHCDLWGTREVKYDRLYAEDAENTQWNELQPSPPLYLFIPQSSILLAEYEEHWKLTEVMSINSSCMNTARDSLVIDTDKASLIERIQMMADSRERAEDIAKELNIQSTGWWNFSEALNNLRNTRDWKNCISRCLYRPFDQRWLFHDHNFIDRPRAEVNRHMEQPNISLVTTRQTKEPFAAVATNLVCGQHKIAAVYDRSYFLPLYLYATAKDELTLEEQRRPNLTPAFLKALAEKLKLPQADPHGLPKGITPEDIFHYATRCSIRRRIGCATPSSSRLISRACR